MGFFTAKAHRARPTSITADSKTVKTQLLLSMLSSAWELRSDSEHLLSFSRELGEGAKAFDVILKGGEEFGAVVQNISFGIVELDGATHVFIHGTNSSVRRSGGERRVDANMPREIMEVLADVKQRCETQRVGVPSVDELQPGSFAGDSSEHDTIDSEGDVRCPKCRKNTALLEDADDQHSDWICTSCHHEWQERTE